MKKVQILMPVYNGEKYLKEQIDSFLRQTYTEWELLIRNDGSKDNSQLIIEDYCKKYPDKIRFIDKPKENLGLVGSLNVLLRQASGEYIMLSDQDDVWLPEKVELSLNEIKRIEKDNKPAMVCTDAICVDENMKVISESFFESQKFISGIMGDKEKMMALNEVQGCTIIINKSALSYIYPLPSFMKIHDMWISLICAHYGSVSYLHKKTLLYRQHGGNTLGSVNVNGIYYIHRIKYIPYLLKSRYSLFKTLPFRVKVFRFIWYKVKYAVVRMF